ncbi:MAG: lytic transglycosylase domain-containing protein [Deltaproteobacteria bacterium]|nr:lytic transglycosylase domain-containing protein [Deltaproteobacteria bacterium]
MNSLLSIAFLTAVLLGPVELGPPVLDQGRLRPRPPDVVQPGPAPKYPSLQARRSDVYDRAVAFIREERFDEALSLIRRQPPDLRSWSGLAVLEAGLISVSEPQNALELYYKIINQKVRDRHWARAIAGYRLVLGQLSAAGDYGARARLIRSLGLEWRNHEARAILDETLAEPDLPQDVKNELLAFKAVLALRVGDFETAGAIWQGGRDLVSLRWLATLRVRQGRFSEAAEARLQAAGLLRGAQKQRELDRTLDILVKGGLAAQAAELLTANPDLKSRVKDWNWRLGLAFMLEGSPDKALRHFAEEEKLKDGRRKASQYYQGRALELLEKTDEAKESYRRAAAGPMNYYRLLAEGRLAALDGAPLAVPLAEPMVRLLDGAGEDKDALGFHLWLSERLTWPWPDLSSSVSVPKNAPGEADRARVSIDHYLALGDRRKAYQELAAIGANIIPRKTKQGDPLADRYVLLAALAGDYRLAVALMARLSPPKGFAGQRWSHPLVLSRPVLRAWRKHGLKPQLILSVIRTESAFQAEVVSSSNARGLMQMLPSTAMRIAALEGDEPPKEETLFDPDLNVRYGTAYLSDLMKAFGQAPLALAAYNGGPFNIKTYMEALPERPLDLFIETLPFAESSKYVMMILESQAIYESAYLGRYNIFDLTSPVGLPPGEPPDF